MQNTENSPPPAQAAQPAHPASPDIAPALAPGTAVTIAQDAPPWWVIERDIRLGMIGTFFVLLPMSIAMAIRMIRRPVRNQKEMSPAVDDRLTRLEQSIDAIAIEMERVSEGQRYVTRLLASDKVAS